MTDRELIQKAARAAGKTIGSFADGGVAEQYGACAAWDGLDWWNPLADDGDALRLAVKLGMRTETNAEHAWAAVLGPSMRPLAIEPAAPDPYAATRRVIVRAAAALADAAGAA